MTRLVVLMACAGASFAQQVLPWNGTRDISDRIRSAPLTAEQKDQLVRQVGARDYKTAETALVASINAAPREPDLLTLAASVFFADKQPLNAAIALKKADRIRPLDAPDRFLLALAYIGMQRNAWARPELERLSAASPENTEYLYWLARIDYDLRQYDSCIARLKRVTELDKSFMKAWDNLGLCEEGAGRLDNAVASYGEANRLNELQQAPSMWPALNLGTLLLKLGRMEEAEPWLRKAVEHEGGSPQAHYRLGLLLEKEGHLDAAVPELRQAVALDTTYADPLYALVRVYRRQGKTSEAAETLKAFEALKSRRGS